MVKEVKTPIFILTSSFICGFFLSFYKFPIFLIIFLILICLFWIFGFSKKHFYLGLWLVFFVIFYLTGYFYFKNKEEKSFSIEREAELLVKIKKVEPYYYGYLIEAFNYSIGNFIFKTDKRYFSPGDTCLISFKGVKTYEYFNPFSIEKRRILLTKEIESELIIDKNKNFICEKEDFFSLEKIRYTLFNFSEKLSGTAKGLIQALVLGVEYNFPEEYKEKLKNQGLYHQLAISGFNLAVLFGIFYKFFYHLFKFTPLIKIGYPLQNISYILALPGAFIILLFSGFCPSALRAFVFLILLVLTKIFFRNTSSLIVLLLTATLILIFRPYVIGNLSFQLSFIATLGLIIGDRIFKFYFKNLIFNSKLIFKIINYFLYLFFISFIVSLFMFPFILYINGNIPLATPFNNLIATFFWSFIFIPFSILIAIFSFFNESIALSLANILGKIFDWYIKIPLFDLLYKFDLPINLVFCAIVFSIFLFIFLSFFIKTYKKYFLWIIIVTLFYLIICYFYYKTFYILIFDVGKGNAILVKNENTNILIDTDIGNFKGFDWTKTYLVPVLNKLGIEIIDLVIISHPDLDHSGGLETIRTYFYVKKEVSGDFRFEDWEKVGLSILPNPVYKPEALKIRKTELFLFPGVKYYEDLNRESLVAYLEYKGLTVLFPGDIDKYRFYRMKERGEIIPVEVLISPHHGSKYSLDEYILDWFTPKVVLTSGRGKYFPHKDYTSLLEKLNIPHFSTQDKGAIFIFPKDNHFLICFEKERRKNFFFSAFFPFIPLYIEDKGCKRFDYHKVLIK